MEHLSQGTWMQARPPPLGQGCSHTHVKGLSLYHKLLRHICLLNTGAEINSDLSLEKAA